MSQAQANLQAASTRAGAYLSSWGAWASEKKKGWQASRSASSTPISSPLPSASLEPSPGDLRRAEEFKKEKNDSLAQSGAAPLSSAKTAPPNVEGGQVKRESVFFDAEKEKERDKEGDGRSKEAENVG